MVDEGHHSVSRGVNLDKKPQNVKPQSEDDAGEGNCHHHDEGNDENDGEHAGDDVIMMGWA